MLGTNNYQFITILKDILKQVLYLSTDKAKDVRNISLEIKDDAHVYSLINKLVGIHQVSSEITAFRDACRGYFGSQPIIICEIGTANSGTGLFLTKTLSNTVGYIGVDLYVKNKSIFRSCFKGKYPFIQFFEGSSYAGDTISRVRSFLGDREIDILFIDGDHTIEGVAKDYEAYAPFVKEGGIIAFHDIVPDYFTAKGVNTNNWSGGVPFFWNKIKNNSTTHFEIIEDLNQDGKGIGYIIK